MLIETFILGLIVISTSIIPAEALPSSSTAQSQSQSQSRSQQSNTVFDWDATRHVLAFGDSYTYIQGTAGHPNYSFIGDEQNYAFDKRALLGDAIVQNQTGTSAGAPNWIEYLTGCGVEEDLTYPVECERQLWDFAFAGAGVSAEFIPLHHEYTVSFVRQIEQYITYGHPILTSSSSSNTTKALQDKGKRNPILFPSRTLTAIWIGINDINDSAAYNYTLPQFEEFYNALLSRVFEALGQLVKLGYRDFVLLNLPPLDRTPANQLRIEKGEEAVPSKEQVELWNSLILQQSETFKAENPSTETLIFDANILLNRILDEPGKYGITNTTHFCPGAKQPDISTDYASYGCPTPLGTYFWFDSGHVTSTVHWALAGELGRVLSGWRGDWEKGVRVRF
ncbi:hypothetical protein BDW69DRAFT_192487 [Aspergillus filifer]